MFRCSKYDLFIRNKIQLFLLYTVLASLATCKEEEEKEKEGEEEE